jgi:hypothetical protein
MSIHRTSARLINEARKRVAEDFDIELEPEEDSRSSDSLVSWFVRQFDPSCAQPSAFDQKGGLDGDWL